MTISLPEPEELFAPRRLNFRLSEDLLGGGDETFLRLFIGL